MTLTLSVSFAGLEKPERKHLFHLLEELALLKARTALHKVGTASRTSDLNPLDALDTLSDDSNDEPVH